MLNTRMAAAVALSTLALGLAGCAEPPPPASPPTPATTKIAGTGTAAVGASDPLVFDGLIIVPAANTAVPSGTGGCKPAKDYEDTGQGAKVEVSDPSGAVIATGALDEGVFDGEGCAFEFQIPDVNGSFPKYGVEIADRGIVEYTREEVDESVLEMSLMDDAEETQ